RHATVDDALDDALNDFFIEMPSFDLNEMLEEDKINESNMRGAFRFAKKFHVSIERGKSGKNYVLEDGTKVWQVGIRSEDAYSMNVLFSEYKIPEGGKLFLYSSDYSHILGSFTHENNSEDNLLPVAPVKGDEIIVEYSEPANVPFEGILKITEVNHDYRGVLRAEPGNDPTGSTYTCMPDVLCTAATSTSKEKDAVVLLIINGTVGCTGSIINNTRNDETPYLLTAMHCLNLEKPITSKTEDYYRQVAGTIIAFFNYNRPVCDTRMKGVEEMSVAGATARAVIEPTDIALLELKNSIPHYYQPYYAGWNVSGNIGAPPYTNIHHPKFSVKKFGQTNRNLSLGNFSASIFDNNVFWHVPGWDTGSTDEGSSGSPLFDAQNLIIGGLTGGQSTCSDNKSDQFSSLHKGWEYNPDNPFQQLKYWLDPDEIGSALTWQGLDPCINNPFEKQSNIDFSGIDSLENTGLASGSGHLFGHNSLEIKEFAEEFNCEQNQELYGAFLLNPPFTNSGTVKVFVFNADEQGKPGAKIDSVVFRPQYSNYSGGQFSDRNKTTLSYGTESFVELPQRPAVKGKFFIGYKIDYPYDVSSRFSVYNALSGQSTAWINHPELGWIKSSDMPGQAKPASLTIQALLRKDPDTTINEVPPAGPPVFYHGAKREIQVNCASGETGILRLYNASGRLIQQYTHHGPAVFPLSSSLKNTLCILQWQSGKEVLAFKFVVYR
ncbi:MAG: lysyl endopeptidase, partial [Dysgonamonadaceae bacterium]|nr:lysyl endopeptidase [Dysgonamonadaceae bacterium]